MRNVEKVKHRQNGTNNPNLRLYIGHYQTSRTNRLLLNAQWILTIQIICGYKIMAWYPSCFNLGELGSTRGT